MWLGTPSIGLLVIGGDGRWLECMSFVAFVGVIDWIVIVGDGGVAIDIGHRWVFEIQRLERRAAPVKAW